VILLALDTCDAKGSVALIRNDVVLSSANHDNDEEYSCWLLPAVHRVLQNAGCVLSDVEAFGVASGPGSFTGVRIGLTTVKAWSEVYAKPIAAISRLKAIAWKGSTGDKYAAAFANARRGQVFGALYRHQKDGLERVGGEMVIAPGEFIRIAVEQASGERLAWATPDAGALTAGALASAVITLTRFELREKDKQPVWKRHVGNRPKVRLQRLPDRIDD